jgi:hypothetical protein
VTPASERATPIGSRSGPTKSSFSLRGIFADADAMPRTTLKHSLSSSDIDIDQRMGRGLGFHNPLARGTPPKQKCARPAKQWISS